MVVKNRNKRNKGYAEAAKAKAPSKAASAAKRQANLVREAWPWAALLLMVAAVYWPALFADFVWDDKVFVLNSTQIQAWSGLLDTWINPAGSNELHFWPMLNTSFWLDHKLWGFNPVGFHATNILLHGINTLLLWRLLTHMAVPGAWLIAALFALHPVHAEPVVWVTARKDLLATCFYLLAFGCWLRFRKTANAGSYLPLLALYAAALFSKTVAITLPAVLLVWVWWQQGRIAQRDLVQVAPLLLLGLAIGAYGLLYYSGRAYIDFEHTFAERLVIASKALWFYAGKLLWPYPLVAIYPHWDVDPTRLLNWLALPAALGLALALWLARHRLGRGPLAGALFFAITLAPMLGFADNSYMKYAFAADRYQYLASLGLMAVLVGALVKGCQWLAAGRALAAPGHAPQRSLVTYGAGALAALVLAVCGLLTQQHIRLFQDEVTLFRHIVATNPSSPRAYFRLGGALVEEAPAEAVEALKTALKREPDNVYTYVRLSNALMALERYEDAEATLRTAIDRGLDLDKDAGIVDPLRQGHLGAKLPYNLGIVLLRLERPEKAEAAFRRTLRLEPDNLLARQGLATVLADRGRIDAALALLQQVADALVDQGRADAALALLQEVVEAMPERSIYLKMAEIATAQGKMADAEAYNRRARAAGPHRLASLRPLAAKHYNAGRYTQALEIYQQIIALDPEDTSSYVYQGLALEKLGRLPEAQQAYQKALALEPNHLQALSQLAVIFYNANRFEAALEPFQRLVTLRPDDVQAHLNLGATLAKLGQLQKALEQFETMLSLEPESESARGYIKLLKDRLNAKGNSE